MKTEEILTEFDKVVEESWSLPLSGGKIILDASTAKLVIRKIRSSLPEEVRQAKAIANDRNEIIKKATREANAIIKSAEERAEAIVLKDELILRAKAKAKQIEETAKVESKSLRIATQNYIYDVFKKTDEFLNETTKDFRGKAKNLLNRKFVVEQK